MPIELTQVASLGDVLLQDHFDLIIPAIPGGGDGQSMTIRNLTASLPGRSNTAIAVELHRHKVHFAGKRTYSHSFTATYIDTADRKVIDALINWQNQITDSASGLPRPKTDYATVGVVNIYGSNNSVVETRTFYGLFISSIGDINLSGANNAPMEISVTFNFDYWN